VIAHAEYELRCRSDFGPSWSIREHLPVLRALADECDSAYELGVGAVVSTWAFLSSSLRDLTSVDIAHPEGVGGDLDRARTAAAEMGKRFTFLQASSLEIERHQVDLTFIDTLHTFGQLLAELRRFAPFTRRYLVLHDTEVFGTTGEDGVAPGLRMAIDVFLRDNPGWALEAHYPNNHGLTVLKRRQTTANVMAVTGFVENAFPARHLDQSQFRALGTRLRETLGDRLTCFDNHWRLPDCWAFSLLQEQPLLLPTDPAPPPDRYASHRHAAISNIVLAQRFEWVRLAAQMHRDVEVFVWVEYNVLKQQGVTPEVLRSHLDRIEQTPIDAMHLPGIWPSGVVGHDQISWRFAGSTWICPRYLVEPLAEAAKSLVSMRVRTTGRISWDTNTLAEIEMLGLVPMQWYPGGHDATQFTGFGTSATA